MALARFSRTTDLPLYNQPSDTDLYHDNKRRYEPYRHMTRPVVAASMTGVAPEAAVRAAADDGTKASTHCVAR